MDVSVTSMTLRNSGRVTAYRSLGIAQRLAWLTDSDSSFNSLPNAWYTKPDTKFTIANIKQTIPNTQIHRPKYLRGSFTFVSSSSSSPLSFPSLSSSAAVCFPTLVLQPRNTVKIQLRNATLLHPAFLSPLLPLSFFQYWESGREPSRPLRGWIWGWRERSKRS